MGLQGVGHNLAIEQQQYRLSVCSCCSTTTTIKSHFNSICSKYSFSGKSTNNKISELFLIFQEYSQKKGIHYLKLYVPELLLLAMIQFFRISKVLNMPIIP